MNAHQASDAELALAAEAGIGWVRMDFNWQQFEPAQGEYDWSIADRFVGTAMEHGLNVFATVAYTPAWAVAGGCNDAAPDVASWCRNAVPTSTADWTDFVSAAVNRYGNRIKHWGMWNEPNLEHFFRGSSDDYVDVILRPGSEAVHAECDDCFVLGPDLAHMRGSDSWNADAGTCVLGECIFNGWEVSLTDVLLAAGSSIDIITHHNYESSSASMWGELTDGEFLIIKYMHGVKEITDTYAPGKPVWITEFGYEAMPGGEFTEFEAARQLGDTFDEFFDVRAGMSAEVANQPWPEMDKLFWYDLTDDPTTYDWGTFTWGLLTADHTPKEAWYTYADLTLAYGGCMESLEDLESDTGDGPHWDTGDGSDSSDEDDPGADSFDPTDTDDSAPGESDSEEAASGGQGAADAAGPSTALDAKGCSCSASSGMSATAWLLLVPLIARRRVRTGLLMVGLTACSSGGDKAPELVECTDRPDFSICGDPSGETGEICISEECVTRESCDDVACPEMGPTFAVPDTNVRVCFGPSPGSMDGEIPCPGTPDDAACADTDYCGQDGQYGWDVDHDAIDRFVIYDDGVVDDQITGLSWQRCAGGQTDLTCEGDGVVQDWYEASAYCEELDLAGATNWKLPTAHELQSIADYSVTGPTLDTSVFPNAPSNFPEDEYAWWVDCIWSSSLSVDDPDAAWVVMSNNGDVAEGSGVPFHMNDREADGWGGCTVRCVQETEAPRWQRFLTQGDSEPVVLDTVGQRTWQGCSAGQTGTACSDDATMMPWVDALSYCQGLSWGGHDDWRLPNIKELRSIVDERFSFPAIDPDLFPSTPHYLMDTTNMNMGQYWTSTARDYHDFALYVGFNSGMSHFYVQSEGRHARCVRGP